MRTRRSGKPSGLLPGLPLPLPSRLRGTPPGLLQAALLGLNRAPLRLLFLQAQLLLEARQLTLALALFLRQPLLLGNAPLLLKDALLELGPRRVITPSTRGIPSAPLAAARLPPTC